MAASKTGKKHGATESATGGGGVVLGAFARLHSGGSPFRSLLRQAAQPAVRLHHYRELRERALRGALCRQAAARLQACAPREPR